MPVSGPAVTTRVRGPFCPRLRPAGAARAAARRRRRPARPPNRSARTTRNAAKMNSHSSSRKPKRKICRTISGVTTAPRRAPCVPASARARTAQAGSRAVLPVDEHRVADADDVAVDERLPADPAAVDQGAVGGAEVLDRRRAAVEDDVDVLAADAGVGQPDVGLGAAADDVAPGRELVPGARAVDDEDVRDAGPGAGAADDRGTLLAGVGGDPAAQRGERRQRRGGRSGPAAGGDGDVLAGRRRGPGRRRAS